mgnify:CR=1 FL=1
MPFFLASTLQEYSPSSLRQIRDDMLKNYVDLVDNPGRYEKHISSTLRFSHVTPPVNGTSTWRASASSDYHHLYDLHEPKDKPIAIYLPGLDGTGISAFTHQFEDMAETFELWRMIVTTENRDEFRQILRSAVDFVEEIARNNSGREIVLVGESFGGVLASAVALNIQKKSETRHKDDYRNPLKGLVLVNPATAFHDTNWDVIVPVLSSLQYLRNNQTGGLSAYSVAGGLALSYLIPSSDQFQTIATTVLEAVGIPPPQDAVEDMVALLDILEQRLPADTLLHRVNSWLSVGTQLVNDRLKNLQIATLVVAGDQDRIMPSGREVERLVNVIPTCEKLLVRGKGHFVLDDKVNLTEAILYSDIDPLNWKDSKAKRYDPIADWKPPPKEEIDATIERQVKQLRDIYSPVFFSTDARGKRWMGLSKVPRETDGPLLFVANHQFGKIIL